MKKVSKVLALILCLAVALGINIGAAVDSYALEIGDTDPDFHLGGCPIGENHYYILSVDNGNAGYIKFNNSGKITDRESSFSIISLPFSDFEDTLAAGQMYHTYTPGWEGSECELCQYAYYGDRLLPVSPSTETNSEHVHNFVTGVIYDATCDMDGLEGTYCKTCGFIKESSPISAFGFALEKYAKQKIDAAKSGQNIVLEFGELNSFPKSFMEKIAAKVAVGVSFEFRYMWNHELQKIKIPAGTVVDTNLDWYGPATMQQLYGAN